ncbi:MAG: dynamin family protein [Bacillota bacterium]
MEQPADLTGLKRDTVAGLRDVSRLAMERGERALSGHLDDRADRLDQDQFNLVVLGQFKRGKSTLINALVGHPVLPMGVVPLTSVVTKVRFGLSQEAVVRFLDGTSRRVVLEDLHRFVTEKENPKNRLRVDEVSVVVPSAFLSRGLVLVDTPGVGSTYEHNTDTALRFLPRADAGLFVVAADPPLSLAEREFLGSVRPFVAKLFFVLNKVDYLTPEETHESLQFTAEQLREALQSTDIEVLPVSAKQGIEAKQQGREDLLESSGLSALQRRIGWFIASGKTGAMLLSAGQTGAHACEVVLGGLSLEKRALQMTLDDLVSRVARLEDELQKAEAEQRDDLYLLDGEEKRLVERIENDLVEFRASEQPRLEVRVREIFREHADLTGTKLRKAVEKRLFEEVEATLERFRPEEEGRVDRYFSDLSERFAERAKARMARIQGLVSDIFEVRMGGFEAVRGLTACGHLWFLVNPPEVFFPTIDPLTLSAFLPGRRGAGMLEREFRKKVAEELERNCGRLLGYFRQRIADSVRLMRLDVSESTDEFIGTIRASIKRAQDYQRAAKGQAEPAIHQLESLTEKAAVARSRFIDLKERLTT